MICARISKKPIPRPPLPLLGTCTEGLACLALPGPGDEGHPSLLPQVCAHYAGKQRGPATLSSFADMIRLASRRRCGEAATPHQHCGACRQRCGILKNSLEGEEESVRTNGRHRRTGRRKLHGVVRL